MGGAGRFEELIAWQKARELARLAYEATGEGEFSRDFRLSGQIQKSAVSVMSNIAEGFVGTGHREFSRFLTVALASCAELRSQLYVALDVGYLDDRAFDRLHGRAEELARIICALRTSVITKKRSTL